MIALPRPEDFQDPPRCLHSGCNTVLQLVDFPAGFKRTYAFALMGRPDYVMYGRRVLACSSAEEAVELLVRDWTVQEESAPPVGLFVRELRAKAGL